MSPIVPILILAVIALLWIGFCIGCLVLLVWGWRRKQRGVVLLGAIPLVLSAVAVVWLLRGDTRPLDTRARSFAHLPPTAHVVSFEAGDWGDGTVAFRLPATQPPFEWLRTIKKMNGGLPSPTGMSPVHPGSVGKRHTPLELQWKLSSGDSCELIYDRSTDLYQYIVSADT